MKTSDQVKNTNTYNLTAEAGSPRYMAPEVALGQPYNHKVDVYSFALVLWQMCALKEPFADHTIESMTANVYKGNERPDIKSKWPSTVETLIKKCWSRNAEERPECEEAMNSLKEDISTLCDSETAAKLDCSGHTAYSIAAT